MKTKRLVRLALLAALALGLFVLEAQIPALLPAPGFKLGLANLVTVTVLRLYDRRSAALVLAVRVLLGSFLTGTVSALLYSVAGGVCAYAAMAAAMLFIRRLEQLWVVSVLGSIAHTIGQLAVAVFVVGTPAILSYGLVLLIAAVVTGAFNGLCATLLSKALEAPFKNG